MSYLNILLLLILIISEDSCKMHSETANAGRVEVIDYRFRQYTHEDTFLRHPFWDITERVWVKDSVAIEEVRKINIVSDSKGDTTTYPIMMYRYTNLKTAEVYEFNAFLERSTLRRKYMLYDTVSVASGWGFKVNRRLSEGASIQFLPDTIVNGKKYLHGIFTRTTGGIEYNFDGWFLTSPQKTLFSLDQTSYRSTGVPMVGYHQYPLGKRGLKAVMDVTFITDTLTADEERIFAAWEKYAKQHPVK